MKKLLIFIFFINIFSLQLQAQEEKTVDTVSKKKYIALRVGADISKPIISQFNKDLKSIELTGDFRFSKNYYAAVELGFTDKTTSEDYLTFTTNGSYIKLGVNYNAYENWKGMNNDIFLGMRYGFSHFSQTLNNYTPNAFGTYFEGNEIEVNTEFENLSAHWLEFVFGMKVETLKNIFLGAAVSFNQMLTTKEPENFKNLYVPGFNRVFSNNVGIGFNYSISYLIPFTKKAK